MIFTFLQSDKIRKNELRNIFFIGDAFYASPPVFAQGASQSIEAANELFDILKVNNENSSVVQPNSSTVVAGMGMKRGNDIGDLMIEFEIKFPKKISEEQKSKLKEIL